MFNEKQKLCVSVFHQVRTLLHQSQSYAAKMPFYAAKVPFYAAKVPFYAARMQVGISPAAGSVVSLNHLHYCVHRKVAGSFFLIEFAKRHLLHLDKFR